VGKFHLTPQVSTKLAFSVHPLRYSVKLVEFGARSMFFVDLKFLELRCLARKNWSRAFFLFGVVWSPAKHALTSACFYKKFFAYDFQVF
jgi:hypothetical protein